ncbi:hypothetical protein COCMIDRAFT_91365, partial [Bipolaris oryzae ATCC 44560]
VTLAILGTLTPSHPTQPYSPCFAHDSATGVGRKSKAKGNTAHTRTILPAVLHVHIALESASKTLPKSSLISPRNPNNPPYRLHPAEKSPQNFTRLI